MKRLVLILCCALSFQLQGQQLVSIEQLGYVSLAEMQNDFGFFMQYGVTQYRMEYTSTDLNGEEVTLSGFLAVPDQTSYIYPRLIYQHGTVGSPDDVPSNLAGGYELAMVFAGRGYITLAPDFLGLGVHDAFHPYVHAESEAQAAIDMLIASAEGPFGPQESILYNDQVFITGYSQGGHAAMAAYKYLQEDYADEFTVTAAAPMSGPYDISGTMKDLSLTTTEEYNFPAYIVYTALSYNEAYGTLYEDLEDFFRPEFVPMIQQFYDDEVNLFSLNSFLITNLTSNYGGSYPYYILQDSISNALANDPDHPANLALADNDLYDWEPLSPTRMFYCMADDQVPFENSVIAEGAMLSNGASDVDAIDVNPAADHGGCVEPATIATIGFFDSFAEIGPYLTVQEASANGFQIFPNPSSDQLQVRLPENVSEAYITLSDLQGRTIWTRPANDTFEADLGSLPSGMYQLSITTEAGIFFEKIVKQ